MKINEILHGFRVISSSRINEINGTLYDLRHEGCGARLLYLDRQDENKTFAIAFKTIPKDDTGVFHIMEHSVLCGSRKFPVKDPFTELIKGSITTYLNAFTSGDKTVYPVSSKNDKAFHGLVDVYLDAVLHPLALENPFIFMQEGHRLELDEDDKLSLTGVVYNEMKGVYSSADEYADYLITRRVSPNSTYSYDSGGNPDFIPELTYEDFKAAHEKFYHPSNACLFLDGEVKLDEILPLIDSYLSEYDFRENDIEIDDGGAPITEPLVTGYPIEAEEDPTDKTRVYICHNTFPHRDSYKSSALSLVCEAIADSNNAPLTKKILDTGLCESFSFFPTRSYSLNALNAIFIGVKDGKAEELIAAYKEAVAEVLSSGIPKDNLTAALGRREFRVRESDFGTYPAGMVYMSSCIEYALFGENPEDALKYENNILFLREKLNTGYYEELLTNVLSSPASTLILHPDNEFTKRKEKELEARLDELSNSMSDEEKSELKRVGEELAIWQSTPNTDEELATIPTLTKEDLKINPRKIPTEIVSIDGCEVILHPIHTGGISYPELYFDASDAEGDEIFFIRLFSDMLAEWDTEKGSVTAFRNRVKNDLGALYLSLHPTKNGDDVKLYIALKLSCLDTKKDEATALAEEHLYSTLFNNPELLIRNVKQLYTYSVESIVSRGDAYAMMRDAAKHSSFEALTEALFGYSYHVFLKKLSEQIDKSAEEVIARFEKIRDKYLRRERLTVAISEPSGLEFAKRLVSIIRTGGESVGASGILPLPAVNEGIAAPVTVSFASRAGNLNEIGEKLYTGAFALLTNIISFEILWNEIRLKRGAYDTGFSVKPNSGTLGCYSYRDPSPESSVDFFANVHSEINAFLEGSPDLLKYMIGVVGSADTVSTPRNDGANATRQYLAGKTYDDLVRARMECLDANIEELKRISEIIGEVMKKSTFTVVGPRDTLEAMKDIDAILDI